jgi:sortase A
VFIKVAGFQQWKSPTAGGGWHESSALLGQPGNTVMNGHHNIYGKVFARLVDLEPGDLITVYGAQQAYVYEVANKMLLREKYQDLDVRMDNARWILPSEDERLTLITCWPPETNTHRLIIVARPLGTGP